MKKKREKKGIIKDDDKNLESRSVEEKKSNEL